MLKTIIENILAKWYDYFRMLTEHHASLSDHPFPLNIENCMMQDDLKKQSVRDLYVFGSFARKKAGWEKI